MLNIDGGPPDVAAIRDGCYPLTDEICIVTAVSKNPAVEPFPEWVLSTQGQAMLEELGFVPINPIHAGIDRPKFRPEKELHFK